MRGIFLGTGTAIPNPRRRPSGILLEEKGRIALIDSGPGAIHTAAEAGVFPGDIHRLFYTHLHPDHTLDYISFLFALHNLSLRERGGLEVYGPLGFESFHRGVVALYGEWVEPGSFPFFIRELAEEVLQFPEYRVETKKTSHSRESIGYRFTTGEGKVLAISGDTGYAPEIAELGREADVLVLECALPDEMETAGHLTPSLAGEIAREARCRTLYLTHFYPPCDKVDLVESCGRKFRGKIFIAEDLDEFFL